jgi:uncharacterized membrane protein
LAALLPYRAPDWTLRAVIGWDAGAFTLCALAWWRILCADAKQTEQRAGAEDPGRMMVWVIALVASVASLLASVGVLRRVHEHADGFRWTLLTLLGVGFAWALTHTVYTLHYAHMYYRRGRAGGLEFPGGQLPADIDFAYFAFTIGCCFQTSDVAISSSTIRRVVLLHSVLSFLFNTAVLALALNLTFGMLDGGP